MSCRLELAVKAVQTIDMSWFVPTQVSLLLNLLLRNVVTKLHQN